MKLRKPHGIFTALGIVMLAFAASTIFSFNNLRKYDQLAQSEITDSTWILAQAQFELERLSSAVTDYVGGAPDDIDKTELLERMDIFWSRLPLMLEGREGRRLSQIEGAQDSARHALETLQRLEPAVKTLARGDREAYARIRAEIDTLKPAFAANLTRIREWQEQASTIRAQRLDRIYAEMIVASAGILMSGACLVLLLLHEIREAHRAREGEKRWLSRLSDAIESYSDGFSLFDKDDRLVLCNEEYRTLYSATKDDMNPGTPFEAILRANVGRGKIAIPSEDEEDWIRQRLQRRRNPAEDFELQHTDGRWLRVSERRTRDGGCVSIHTDITPLKRRQEDLADRQRRADSANRAKTDFLLTMSHELRTPLNAIMGFSEVMKQEMRGPLGNAHYVDYANDIYQSARHLLAVINNILDISRIEAGRLELDEQAVAIGDEIDRALRLLEDQARLNGIRLVRDIAGDLPLLLGDPHKIQQIVINLAGNAITYMPAGTTAGSVTVRALRGSDGGIVLSVEDTGQGMSAEDLERVISPFVRLSNPMIRQNDGTGLGLPLVKALVELHGGHFELSSQVGKGTTATARFPKDRVLAGERNAPESTDASGN